MFLQANNGVAPKYTPRLLDSVIIIIGKIALIESQPSLQYYARLHQIFISLDFAMIIRPSRMGERRNAYRILVGNPDGRRPLGRPRRRWVDNIKIDLREVGWDGRGWIDLA
jgi:hypothetical protein